MQLSTDDSKPTPTRLKLTQEDVARLLEEPSADSRIHVMEKISRGYEAGGFDAREVAVAEQIFRYLVKDAEVKVREALAENLKSNSQLPRDIVLGLTKDVESVALPVIESSTILSDSDLIQIIESTADVNRQKAVAKRSQVSERVSRALVETRQGEVLAELVINKGARIDQESYENIIQDFSGDQNIIQKIVEREGLPLTVVEKLVARVSDSLAGQLKQKYQLNTDQLSQETDRAREAATLRLAEGKVTLTELEALIRQLHENQRLSPSIIFTALCRGNAAFFETSLAVLANIPPTNARMLMTDRGDLGFRALYAKAKLPDSMFEATKILLRVVQEKNAAGEKPGTIHYANHIIDRIFNYTEGRPVENLSYIIALIRQNTRNN